MQIPPPGDVDRTENGRFRKIIVSLLLLLGVQCWLMFAGRGGAYWGRNFQILMLAVIAALSCVPAISRRVTAWLDRIAHPPAKVVATIALLLAVGSPVYFYLDAVHQQRTFTLKYQDEFSYLIQARMVAHGRLWEATHPLADFFESFQLLGRPVYASIYFPGAALMNVPGIWLHLPFWMMPLLISGAVVAMLFVIVTELIDLPCALLAALMLVGNYLFRMQSLKLLAEGPAMLLTLTMFFAWLRWRERRRVRRGTSSAIGWAILIGASAGWAAITRPLDALCIAIPIGFAMAWMMLADIRSTRRDDASLIVPDPQANEHPFSPFSRRSSSWRSRTSASSVEPRLGVHFFRPAALTVAAIVLAAAPFLAMQLALDRAVTGRWFQTPFDFYAQRFFPQTSFGFHTFDPAARPQSKLPQVQAYYDAVALPAIQSHTWHEMLTNWGDSRLRQTVVANVPSWLLLMLLPAGVLGLLQDRRKLLLWLMFPIFILLYAFYTFFLAHYPLITAPALVLNVLAGAAVIWQTWPRRRAALRCFLILAIAALTVSDLPEFDRLARDDWFEAPQLARIDAALARLPKTPAIVLFKFASPASSEEEPVYNIDTLNPDDAPIIRAHDLGSPRNAELFDYYARRQPAREIYEYDRGTDSLRDLGNVRSLADKLQNGTADERR